MSAKNNPQAVVAEVRKALMLSKKLHWKTSTFPPLILFYMWKKKCVGGYVGIAFGDILVVEYALHWLSWEVEAALNDGINAVLLDALPPWSFTHDLVEKWWSCNVKIGRLCLVAWYQRVVMENCKLKKIKFEKKNLSCCQLFWKEE